MGGDDETAAREAAIARLRRWGGDELVREIGEQFLASVAQRMTAARAALGDGDGDGLARAMHSIRSSALQLGALRAAALCETCEEDARGGSPSDLASRLTALQSELDGFASWFASLDRSPLPQ